MPRKPRPQAEETLEAARLLPHSLVGHKGSLHSWPGPAHWPLPLPWTNRVPPFQRGESHRLPRPLHFSHSGPYSWGLLPPLTSALPSPPFLFAIKDIHRAPCSFPRTFCVISHSILGPLLAGGGALRQSSEIRSLGAETSQGSRSFQEPWPGPFPSARPSLSSASPLVSGPGPFGAIVRNPMVLRQVYLGSARGLLLLRRAAFPQAPLTSGEPPDAPCPHSLTIQPLPPSPATASGPTLAILLE